MVLCGSSLVVFRYLFVYISVNENLCYACIELFVVLVIVF